jgi:N-methylhydantoinase A
MVFQKGMDVKYFGEMSELFISVPNGPITPDSIKNIESDFHVKHEKIIGSAQLGYPMEVICLYLTGTSKLISPKQATIAVGTKDASKAIKGRRSAYFDKKYVEVNVYNGDELLAGNILNGPCIIEEIMTTVVIPTEYTIKVDDYGNYIRI